MDLALIERLETVVHTVKDPWGAETEIKVELYGRHSTQFAKAITDNMPSELDSEDELAQKGAKQVIGCIKSLKGMKFDGKEVKVGDNKLVEILASNNYAWLYDQLHRVIYNPHLFFIHKQDKV